MAKTQRPARRRPSPESKARRKSVAKSPDQAQTLSEPKSPDPAPAQTHVEFIPVGLDLGTPPSKPDAHHPMTASPVAAGNPELGKPRMSKHRTRWRQKQYRPIVKDIYGPQGPPLDVAEGEIIRDVGNWLDTHKTDPRTKDLDPQRQRHALMDAVKDMRKSKPT